MLCTDTPLFCSKELPSLLESLLPPPSADRPDLLAQILPLLLETSFLGNPTRIDYGTGHELAFFLFLYALRVAEVLGEEDDEGVVLRVFDRSVHLGFSYLSPLVTVVLFVTIRYLDLVWELQDTYKLEPAGSHGVWGLDDYCFLPLVSCSAWYVFNQLSDFESFKQISLWFLSTPSFFPSSFLPHSLSIVCNLD